MYYPEEIVDQVRSANDIVDVIGQSVQLRKQGSNYVGLCPFHNEKTPSFSVSGQKQMFYCFGCHKGGNVITFMEEYNNMNFREAVQALAQRAGIKLPETDAGPEAKRQRSEKQEILNLNKMAANWFYYMLRSHAGQAGMDYLRKRQLTDETMKSFALGYAPQAWDYLYRYLKSKGVSDGLLRRSGLMNVDERHGRIYDKFRDRVIFPILDINNHVIGFGGRVMGDAKPKYLNSPDTPVFDKSRNLYALNAARRSRRENLILCEGYMDVISMHQAGFSNAVASLGTALTKEHVKLLSRYTKKIILSYDSDNAGVAAAMRAIPMLRAEGITPSILKLDPYKDPDEFIKAQGKEAFEERLSKGQNAFLFECGVLKKGYDLSDPDGKTAFFDAVAELIASFKLEMERQNYIDTAAREFFTDPGALREMVVRKLMLGQQSPRYKAAEEGRDPGRVRERQLEKGSRKSPGEQTGNGSGPDQENPEDLYYASFANEAGGEADGFEEETEYFSIPAEFYEDERTGDMYQKPRTAVRANREGSVRQQGENASRFLLLNYLTQYPAIFPVVKKYLAPEDFGEGLSGRLAQLIYEMLEKSGTVDQASILSRFESPEDQQKIAEVFHTLPPVKNDMERQKGVAQALRKVLEAAPGDKSFSGAVARQKKLEELRKIQIPLSE